MKTFRFILLAILFTLAFFPSSGQSSIDSINITSDSTTLKKGFIHQIIHYFNEAKKDKSQKGFDLSFIGGPNYSVDTKFGIGVLGSGVYRLDQEDLTLPPSDVSMYANISTSGFFSVGISGNNIFPEDKYRIIYNTYFDFMPRYYYGIGYEAGKENISTKFDEYTYSAKADFLRKIFQNAYAGFTLTAQNIQGKHFKKEEMIPEESLNNNSIGGGIIFSYDSRDFIPNPQKGIYIQYRQQFFPTFLGSTHKFNRIEITGRTYKQVWKKGILAFDIEGIFNNGNTPWNMLSNLGGSRQMRGYYSGQYRDKKQINAQIELRQKIKNRHGFVLWVGAGNIFNSFRKWEWRQTLPTYGIGYRWEFKHRINVRLDYGRGQGQSGFYFNINEAF